MLKANILQYYVLLCHGHAKTVKILMHVYKKVGMKGSWSDPGKMRTIALYKRTSKIANCVSFCYSGLIQMQSVQADWPSHIG